MSESLEKDVDALAFVMRCIAETPDLYIRARESVDMTTRLREDLGIDSIGLVSLFYAVSDALGVEADEDDTKGLLVLGDVVALARKLAYETRR